MTTRTLEQRQVAGLHVNEWTGSGLTVLGLPGLGSSGLTWSPLAASLPDARVIGPDPRGRGGSRGLGGPTGLRQHARDMAAVAEELDLRDVVLVGHSMGAYLAPLVAQEMGDRVAKVVMVDGGIRPDLPFFMGPAMTRLSFGRQLKKGDRAWPDVQAFAKKGGIEQMFASRPDLLPGFLAVLEGELEGPPGALRPRVDVEHATADAIDTFFGPDVVPALQALAVPGHVLLAENMKKDGQRPFIADKAVAPWRAQANLTITRLPGNHVTVVYAPEVVAAISS